MNEPTVMRVDSQYNALAAAELRRRSAAGDCLLHNIRGSDCGMLVELHAVIDPAKSARYGIAWITPSWLKLLIRNRRRTHAHGN